MDMNKEKSSYKRSVLLKDLSLAFVHDLILVEVLLLDVVQRASGAYVQQKSGKKNHTSLCFTTYKSLFHYIQVPVSIHTIGVIHEKQKRTFL